MQTFSVLLYNMQEIYFLWGPRKINAWVNFPTHFRSSKKERKISQRKKKIICGKSESGQQTISSRYSKQLFLEAPSLKYLLISLSVSLNLK